MTFQLMSVRIIFSSVWVAEWLPFGNLFTRLTICSLSNLTIRNCIGPSRYDQSYLHLIKFVFLLLKDLNCLFLNVITAVGVDQCRGRIKSPRTYLYSRLYITFGPFRSKNVF